MNLFAYTSNELYEVKGRLYQIEEKMTRKCMLRAYRSTSKKI